MKAQRLERVSPPNMGRQKAGLGRRPSVRARPPTEPSGTHRDLGCGTRGGRRAARADAAPRKPRPLAESRPPRQDPRFSLRPGHAHHRAHSTEAPPAHPALESRPLPESGLPSGPRPPAHPRSNQITSVERPRPDVATAHPAL
ncbi:putative uncharacterized protein encoded by BRWD1-AS2 [Suncus etruscus]|uniref:putative uncharacterized protein encoded by BRWD1-AS2 n=1 Tax=Suncus etruscus TaxID=109475 RepID=UPI002110B0B1|nr:putative uncharacterized protein encoded by BRWD1-AS2 [Suncus etruscus]